MAKLSAVSIFTTLLSSLLLIISCSSSDDGNTSASVPANAVVINNSPVAEATIVSAIATGTAFVGVLGVEVSTTITGRDILNILLEKINRNTNNTNTTAIASGVAFSEPCLVSGSVSGDETETSLSGNLNSCNDGDGYTLSGTFSANGTSTPSGPFNINISANITIAFDTNGGTNFGGFNSGSVTISNFNYAANGNDATGAYTATALTYAVSPAAGGGFAVQLTQPLTGNNQNFCQLTGGQVLATGAEGSQARGTVNSNGTVKVEYHNGDGIFMETDNSPLGCLL